VAGRDEGGASPAWRREPGPPWTRAWPRPGGTARCASSLPPRAAGKAPDTRGVRALGRARTPLRVSCRASSEGPSPVFRFAEPRHSEREPHRGEAGGETTGAVPPVALRPRKGPRDWVATVRRSAEKGRSGSGWSRSGRCVGGIGPARHPPAARTRTRHSAAGQAVAARMRWRSASRRSGRGRARAAGDRAGHAGRRAHRPLRDRTGPSTDWPAKPGPLRELTWTSPEQPEPTGGAGALLRRRRGPDWAWMRR
jgi:hypothetical protein